jgi:hypothetical protein
VRVSRGMQVRVLFWALLTRISKLMEEWRNW